MNRLLFDLMLVVCFFLTPWWVGFLLAIIGIFIFKNFYEFLFYGIFLASTFGFEGSRLISSDFWLPVILLCIFFILVWLKRFVIFNEQ